jgi:hypothetical protein
MDFINPAFKVVCVTFAALALGTGAQAIIDPVGFSRSFGLPLDVESERTLARNTVKDQDEARDAKSGARAPIGLRHNSAETYVSLMGVRQLGTGITLLTFAYQGNWSSAATLLAIIGVVVAGTDGFFLTRGGNVSQGRFHAIPGAGISALAAAALYRGV